MCILRGAKSAQEGIVWSVFGKGVFHRLRLSKASLHDVHYLKELPYQFSHKTIIADKAYISSEYQMSLFEKAAITLETPMRKNQRRYKPQAAVLRKGRRRIETLFSQLCDQLVIRRNYAKSFCGFISRVFSKIFSLIPPQYLNKFLFNKPINFINACL